MTTLTGKRRAWFDIISIFASSDCFEGFGVEEEELLEAAADLVNANAANASSVDCFADLIPVLADDDVAVLVLELLGASSSLC